MTAFTAVATATLLPTGGLTAGWALARCRLRQLHHEVDALRGQARDSVTGGPTRAAWESVTCARLAAPESTVVIIADLDRFKAINDEHGHPAGDAVLRTMVERLTEVFSTRQGEVCRLGGDEFGIVATDTDLAYHLDALAENVTAPINLPAGPQVRVGISFGCFRVDAGQDPTLSHALEAADQQLRAVKRHRNAGRREQALQRDSFSFRGTHTQHLPLLNSSTDQDTAP